MGKSNLDKEDFEHPSFATISVSRSSVSGPGMKLFGSPFKHHHVVFVEISPASLSRKLHNDRIGSSGGVSHIRVAMSETQLASLLLQTNCHGGVPCTVESIGAKRLPEPPDSSLKKLWAKEVKKDFKDIADAARKAEEDIDAILAKDRITKADIKVLKDTIYGLSQDIRENMPWMQEQFQEAMDKTVAAAKGEIEAHVESVIRTTGLKSLGSDQLPKLEVTG